MRYDQFLALSAMLDVMEDLYLISPESHCEAIDSVFFFMADH